MQEVIYLVKNGISYSIQKLGFIERPFSFVTTFGKEFRVEKDEQPIFFARKRMRVSGKGFVKKQYIHRFCVGVKRTDGSEEKNWIFPDGSFDCTGTQPSK